MKGKKCTTDHLTFEVDCSQSPIFLEDRQDRALVARAAVRVSYVSGCGRRVAV